MVATEENASQSLTHTFSYSCQTPFMSTNSGIYWKPNYRVTWTNAWTHKSNSKHPSYLNNVHVTYFTSVVMCMLYIAAWQHGPERTSLKHSQVQSSQTSLKALTKTSRVTPVSQNIEHLSTTVSTPGRAPYFPV